MSRCFPFPPPGYEKKTTTDDLDLLKKEKQKEKHKKEKKDKEKREGKEKRDKDKGDGKHREKKDKKEKSRDKKKDKDRDRGKDKSSNLDEKSLPGNSEGHDREISTEKRFPGQSESHNGEKVSNDKRSAGRSEGHNGERVSYEQRLPLQSKSRSEDKFIPKEEKDQHRVNLSNERSSAGQFAYCNGGKANRGIPRAENAQDSKFTQELDRRVREESRGTANHIVDKFTGSVQKRDEGILNPVGKATINGAGGDDKKENRGDGRKIDEQGIRDDTRFSGNSMVENFSKVDETRVEGIARPLEANIERKMEGKEKTKEKGDDDKRRDKRKDRDKEKKSKGKDKDRDKERKKEEKKKAKQKKENKSVELDQVKESIKNDIIGTHDVKALCLSEYSNKNAASEETLRKRKHTETNGFLHADESRPNKMPGPALSSHSLSKNGRILDPCQTLIPSNSDRQGAATNLKVDSNNDQVNGAIEAQPASFTKLPLGTAQADLMAEASRIPPPHPDSKYLSQILAVPKIEDLPDTDEQDWLFSGGDSLSKKCELGSVRDNESPIVWSEAVLIASADVYALPYVLPY